MLLKKEIKFTFSEVREQIYNEKKILVGSAVNSEIVYAVIRHKLGNFPCLNIHYWEVTEDSFLFYERYTLTVFIDIFPSLN